MTIPSRAPGAAISTEELAARARDGSRQAFDELVVRCRPRLVAFLTRRLGDTADAEDVAQDTFLRAFDHLDRYDPARPFETWLFAIGKNVAANHAVARTRRDAREHGGRRAYGAADGAIDFATDGAIDGAAHGAIDGAAHGAAQGAAHGAAHGAIDGAAHGAIGGAPSGAIDDGAAASDLWRRAAEVLSPDSYRLLWLRYAQGLTVREIAGELGRSSVAIKVMLFRARRRLLQEVR